MDLRRHPRRRRGGRGDRRRCRPQVQVEDLTEPSLEERPRARDVDRTSRESRERGGAVVGQAARDDAVEPGEVRVAVQRQAVQRDASAQQPHADRGDLVVTAHTPVWTSARRPTITPRSAHAWITASSSAAQVAAGVRPGAEVDDRIAHELARPVERERSTAVDPSDEPSARLDPSPRPTGAPRASRGGPP